MKVKCDHRSKFSNLSNWKEEAWKTQGFNGIRTRDLRDTGAMLLQPRYKYELFHINFTHHITLDCNSSQFASALHISFSVSRARVEIAPVSRRSRVQILLKPWIFQASSFKLLRLENLL